MDTNQNARIDASLQGIRNTVDRLQALARARRPNDQALQLEMDRQAAELQQIRQRLDAASARNRATLAELESNIERHSEEARRNMAEFDRIMGL